MLMNCAVVDIGANTIRLSIFAIDGENPILLFNKKKTAGLANYNDNGYLNEDGINTLISVLKKYKDILTYYPVDKKYIFATASLRNVKNSSDVLEKVKNELGLDIDLLSGKHEANFGFLGISSAIKSLTSGICVDIGGGSTEIVLFKNRKVKDIFNLDEGCLSLHKSFVENILPREFELKEIDKYLIDKMNDFNSTLPEVHTIVGIGGTIRSTGKVLLELGITKHKRNFDFDSVKKLYKLLLENDPNAYHAILKVAPDRVHTLHCGLVILIKVCEIFKAEKIEVSSFGLREGYVINKLTKKGV